MSDLVSELAAIAPQMRKLVHSAQAEVFYEMLSGSLIWTDEIPESSKRQPGSVECLRPVFRFRSSLIIGNPEEQYRPYWEEAERLFPNWPGFTTERRSESFRSTYETLRADAMQKIDDLFD